MHVLVLADWNDSTFSWYWEGPFDLIRAGSILIDCGLQVGLN